MITSAISAIRLNLSGYSPSLFKSVCEKTAKLEKSVPNNSGNNSFNLGSQTPSFAPFGANKTTCFFSRTIRSISIKPTKVFPSPTPSHKKAPPKRLAIFIRDQ